MTLNKKSYPLNGNFSKIFNSLGAFCKSNLDINIAVWVMMNICCHKIILAMALHSFAVIYLVRAAPPSAFQIPKTIRILDFLPSLQRSRVKIIPYSSHR